MTEQPKGWRGPQKAVILAGILLSCTLHLGAAQKKVSLILEPPNPQVGQDVTLAVRGGPQRFTLCEWNREPRKGDPVRILEYLPGPPPLQRNGTAYSRREIPRADCSLRIARLRASDTGNYSVFFEVTGQEQGQRPDQQQEEYYSGSVYLKVSGSTGIPIPVRADPQQPHQGGEVTLTPQRTPGEIVFCEWLKEVSSGNIQTIWPKEQQFHQSEGTSGHSRVTGGSDCSLRMKQLTTADSGTYKVKMEVLQQQQQQPGQGSRPQESDGVKEYWGQVELKINQGSTTGQQASGSAGLSHSVGILTGALLGFFAWTDTLASLFHVLCFP